MIESYNRKTKFMELKPYCHHAKDYDFMEVTEWHNGEGFDVTIGKKIVTFTWGEWEALQALVAYKE